MSSVIPLDKEARSALEYLERHPELLTAREQIAAERAWEDGYSLGYDNGLSVGIVSSIGA